MSIASRAEYECLFYPASRAIIKHMTDAKLAKATKILKDAGCTKKE